jgi:hypothetical protein
MGDIMQALAQRGWRLFLRRRAEESDGRPERVDERKTGSAPLQVGLQTIDMLVIELSVDVIRRRMLDVLTINV